MSAPLKALIFSTLLALYGCTAPDASFIETRQASTQTLVAIEKAAQVSTAAAKDVVFPAPKGDAEVWSNLSGVKFRLLPAKEPYIAAMLITVATDARSPTLTLTWKDTSSGKDGFVIERSLDGNAYSKHGEVPANTTKYVEEGLAPGSYWYRVRPSFGENKAPKVSSSVTWQHVPNTDERYIQTVRLVVTGNDAKRKFSLTWEERPDAKGYAIERSENDGAFVKYGEVAAGVTTFQEPKLAPGTFVYRVSPIR